jgi:hypothetical protein
VYQVVYRAPVPLLLATCMLVMISFGCGQKQHLRSDDRFPKLVRAVTQPAGFEVWFKHSKVQRIALWTRKGDTYGTPIYFAASDPVKLNNVQHTVHVRFAYATAAGLGPVSPPTILTRVQAPELPTVTCKRLAQGHELKIQWHHRQDDGSQRLSVLRNGQVEGILSREESQRVLPDAPDELEVVYEERLFRSARWAVSCR